MTLVPDVAVTRLLDDAVRSSPAAPALALGTRTLTYLQLQEQVDRCAHVLIQLGVRRGDRVALVLPDCPQWVVTFFGVLRLGAVVVAHNPRSTQEQLRHQLADCGAEVVVCSEPAYPRVQAVRDGTAVREVLLTTQADAIGGGGLRGAGSAARRLNRAAPGAEVRAWGQLMRAAPAGRPDISLDPGMVAALAYTAGSTGPARGAILTHRNLVANAHQCSWWLHSPGPGREVVLGLLPLFHPLGLTLCLTSTMVRGGLLALLPGTGPEGHGPLLQAIARVRPTLLPAVPPQLRALLDDPATAAAMETNLSGLRAALAVGMPLPAGLREDWHARLPRAPLLEAYGMAETTALTHGRPLDGPARAVGPGDIGAALPLTEARIVAPADPGVAVADGSGGELIVRGPQVFSGYWGRPDAAEMLLQHGWMRTGDLAVKDAAGSFTLLGRTGR